MRTLATLLEAEDAHVPICLYGVILIHRDFKRKYCFPCYFSLTPRSKEGIGLTEYHYAGNAEAANLAMRCHICCREVLQIRRLDACECWNQLPRILPEIQEGSLVKLEDRADQANIWGYLNTNLLLGLIYSGKILREHAKELEQLGPS